MLFQASSYPSRPSHNTMTILCNFNPAVHFSPISWFALLFPSAWEPLALFCRYLVTHLMGADLNNIIKCQKLTDDHVQFLIYQILRGLKVGGALKIHKSTEPPNTSYQPESYIVNNWRKAHWTMLTSLFFVPQYIHSADIIHRVSFYFYPSPTIKQFSGLGLGRLSDFNVAF